MNGPSAPRWEWDASLYSGSAAFYPVGRVAYPAELGTMLADELEWDGSGVLVDVGCGPGSLTLLLAPLFADVVAVDADADMLAEGARLAAVEGLGNVTWRHLRAEALPADLPPARAVTFAQSFHWFDRPQVAATARRMLAPGGAVVHVGATTHQGVEGSAVLPHPRPPRPAIAELVHRYLGPAQRAGQGVLTAGTPADEDEIFRGAGFTGPQRIEVPGRLVVRSADEIAASVYSLSWSAPHLFGADLAAFDRDLRSLLADAAGDGVFSEQMRSITLSIWR